jgi:hypothetical protein
MNGNYQFQAENQWVYTMYNSTQLNWLCKMNVLYRFVRTVYTVKQESLYEGIEQWRVWLFSPFDLSVVNDLSTYHCLRVDNSWFGTGLRSWLNGFWNICLVWQWRVLLFSPFDLSVVKNLYPDHLYHCTHPHCTTGLEKCGTLPTSPCFTRGKWEKIIPILFILNHDTDYSRFSRKDQYFHSHQWGSSLPQFHGKP